MEKRELTFGHLKGLTSKVTIEATNKSTEKISEDKDRKVVLVDVSLLDGSTTPLVRQMLVANPRLQILMMAEAGSVANAETALRYGAVGFLVKPCPMDEITQKILHAFKHRKLDHMP